MDAAAQYAETRATITSLARELSAEQLDSVVPATPEWRVRDVLAHLAGVAADVASGNVADAATDPWTAAQVDARRGRAVAGLLAEWEEHAPAPEGLLASSPHPMVMRLVADVVSHEHDIRGAVDRPGRRDSEAVDTALQLFVMGLDGRLREHNLPALHICADNQEWEVGAGPPQATLKVEPFELLRALSGRRSRAQLEAYDWEGDAAPYLDALPTFGPAASDVVE